MSPSSRLETEFFILEFKPWYRVYFFCPLKLFRHCPQINNEVISENRTKAKFVYFDIFDQFEIRQKIISNIIYL